MLSRNIYIFRYIMHMISFSLQLYFNSEPLFLAMKPTFGLCTHCSFLFFFYLALRILKHFMTNINQANNNESFIILTNYANYRFYITSHKKNFNTHTIAS